jgi:hypothetical protein
LTFTDLNVLDFNFRAIQLNRLGWRDYLTQPNPVAAALMAKMNIKKEERPQVKATGFAVADNIKIRPSANAIDFWFCGCIFRPECDGGGSF